MWPRLDEQWIKCYQCYDTIHLWSNNTFNAGMSTDWVFFICKSHSIIGCILTWPLHLILCHQSWEEAPTGEDYGIWVISGECWGIVWNKVNIHQSELWGGCIESNFGVCLIYGWVQLYLKEGGLLWSINVTIASVGVVSAAAICMESWWIQEVW